MNAALEENQRLHIQKATLEAQLEAQKQNYSALKSDFEALGLSPRKNFQPKSNSWLCWVLVAFEFENPNINMYCIMSGTDSELLIYDPRTGVYTYNIEPNVIENRIYLKN